MRRLRLAIVAVVFCSATLSSAVGYTQSASQDPTVQKLLDEARSGTRAWMQGDSAPFAALMAHTSAFSIYGPFGGPAATWSDKFAQAQAAAASQFEGATASTVDLVQAHVAEDLIVLVLLERSVVRLAGSEPQQWDLRVTQVYERDGADWKIVHRHADPLVVRRDLAQTLKLFHP